jgi:hypothetical protein
MTINKTIMKEINDLVNEHNFLLARSGTDDQFDQIYIESDKLAKQLNISKEEFWETYFNN